MLLSAVSVFAETPKLDAMMKGVQSRTIQMNVKMKQARQSAQEKIKQKQENLQKKVAEIKDVKKKEAANKILEQFNRINRVQTDHFSQILNRFDVILQKIKSRAEKATSAGKDLTAAKQAIQKAEQSIKIAREAVIAQAAKTYTIDSSVIAGAAADEGKNSIVSKLREKFKELRKQMFDDLAALRDGAMKTARGDVHGVAQALTKVPNVDKEPSANSTNQQ